MLKLSSESNYRSYVIILNWLLSYLAQSNSLLFQVIFFVFATDSTFFRNESPMKRVGKGLLTIFYSKSSVINDFRQFYFEIKA